MSNCPYCNSQNVLRCEMAYLQGTKSGYMIGGALTSNDIIPAGAVTRSQTQLASYCRPPLKPQQGAAVGALIGILLGFAAVIITFACYPSDAWFTSRMPDFIYFIMALLFVGLPLFGYFIGAGLGEDEINREKWQQDYCFWQKQWVCLACGKVWIPGPSVADSEISYFSHN